MLPPSTALKGKISVPPIRERAVPRPRLYRRLSEALARPLTLVSAPAGFGKTTLLAAWLHQPDRPVKPAWLTLEGDDNDPFRFISYLAAALQTLEPGVGQTTLSLLGSLQPPRPKDLATLLLQDVEAIAEPALLVLEDYHLVTDPDANALTAYLVDRLPPQLRLIMTSRGEPALPIARWRASERLTEIGPEDLRFLGVETDAFLNDTMGLNLKADAVKELDRRTEGWIAGLQMSALSLQAHGKHESAHDVASVIDSFDGRHRHVIDYLASEVLRQQPDDLRSFLGQVAILDRQCAPLCDAVTGRNDSKEILARLEQANLFLLRLDDHRQWYRFHQLFADFLRSQSDDRERPDLHRRASAWLSEHGFTADAIKHALGAHDIAAAIRLIRSNLEPLLCRGEFSSVLAWLEALPDEAVRAHGDLSGYKAWLLYLRGRIDESETYLAIAEAAGRTNSSSIHVGALMAFQAFLAINRGTPQIAIGLATKALEHLGGTQSFFWACALLLLGNAQRLAGERNAAISTLRETARVGRQLGNQLITLDALGHLAPLMYAKGELREAILLCQSAVDEHVDTRGRPLPPTGLVHVRLGSLYYEIDDLARAQECLTTGLDLCQRLAMINNMLLGHRGLAKIAFASGDTEAAWARLAAARHLADQSGSPRNRRLVDATAAELQLREGNVRAAIHTLGDMSEWADTTTEQERLAHARLLLAQDRPRMADSVLSRLEGDARAENRIGSLITVLVLRARCKEVLGDRTTALQRLEEALSYAASTGYRRVFLDEGTMIAALLAELGHVTPSFVSSLLGRFGHPATCETPTGSPDQPLTKKEVEILHLLNTGLPNKDIAARLAISVGTTKWHVHQIFGKLEVTNRTAAVLKARELGML
ncbi:LuxR family transcriptional regulator, maltose regulon positive regulatory protein [Rhizobiales bacterium GAS113]|nr:LuxR family transcriptional regulator, maltose regulon positive regulatory protein [Rhizobiales bacterium GAS113]